MTPVRQSNRAFALMFAIVFAIITLLGWFFFEKTPIWAVWVSGALLLVAWVCPGVLLPLNRLWGLFAFRLGTVSNVLVLGIVLYGIFAPLAFFFRVIGRDLMNRDMDPAADTYLTRVDRQMDSNSLDDMY